MSARALVAGAAVSLVTVVLGLAHGARAQRFDPQFFHPSPAQRSNPSGIYSADVLPDASFEAGLLFHYDSAPLVVRGPDGERLYDVIGEQASLHILGAVGLFDFLEVGLDVPFVLLQSGDSIPTFPNFDVDASDASATIGDVRLMAKAQLFTTHTPEHPSGAAMAVVLDGFFPSGDENGFQGESWRFNPRLVIDGVSVPGHRVSLNVGYTFRNEIELPGLSVGWTFDWGLAAHFKTTYVDVIPEIRGSIVTMAEDLGPEEIPVEAALTIRTFPIPQLMIQAGGGVGLFQGFGAPDYRIVVGAGWLQRPNPDRDRDGILNADDACPDEPEDIDEFEDENGCPDPDNDQDGILDARDQCPLEPEDRDQFEDQNGCPDPDNDQDTILDDPDQCPNDPEDMDEFEDHDGCPDLDNDGDGIFDPVDQCPTEPEDRDGFEDENGCPDPDNDQDGLLDPVDRCPNEPETMNGFEDTDGCPDQGLVTVTCEAIVIHDKVYFETNRAVIQARSHGLLDQVAAVLGARGDIQHVRVEGHTDSRGSDSHNMTLSNARAHAVREYLLGRGIAATRLDAQGFGETQPIDNNTTSSGRAANRRVEFVITEQTGCSGPAAGPAATP